MLKESGCAGLAHYRTLDLYIRLIDGQIDRWIDKQINRKIDRQTDRQIDRYIDIQIEDW